ncbi:DUF6356 family protein [Altererythrobacter sp. ZODW24]|uniref:DUF6356 family protein n=1 Tax=Altererythrobacter sp. ZODW24 TaxID=2185142 RepID=UPI000DF858B7|nr:DUF6356 family protein [Altererythrobacter sp. ZODW24]
MRIFTDHPKAIGETYGQHFAHATGFGLSMIAGGLACIAHALFPWVCLTTGSDTIRRLYRSMVTGRADLIELDKFESQFDWVI